MSRFVLGSPPGVGVFRPEKFGAVGDGVTDDSNAFRDMMAEIRDSLRTIPYSLQPEQSVTAIVELGPVDYLITDPGALMGDEAMASKGRGITFRGANPHSTHIIFKPATGSVMMTNDYWLFITFENIGFLAGTADCTFLLSNTTHAAQRFTFKHCRWEYWKYGVDLRGSDNNSEFAFTDYHVMFHQNDGVFFFVGASGSDQFLNYWFDRGTFWGTQASFCDLTFGGSVHINDLDVSAWGSGLASTKYLFALRGTSHSEGVCNFQVNGLRWEPMSANAALIYTEWPQGAVTFRNTDMTSQQATYTYGDIIYVNVENTDSAALSFENCQLAGGVRVKMNTLTYAHRHLIRFTGCTWLQKTSPSDVVSYDTSATSGNVLPLPAVEFVRCRNRTNDVWAAAGGAVWDATIGYRGEALQMLPQRTLSVRGAYGIAWGTEVDTIVLPLGALITGIQALSPAGAVTEADGGTWTLATTEGTPTTVATVTVAGALSAGFDVSQTLTVPFECSTAAKAKLTVKATNVAQANAGALFLVKGYW